MPGGTVKFTNITEDTLDVNALGFSVAPGEDTPDLTDGQALGFVLQTERWKPDHPRTAQRLIKEDADRHAVDAAAADPDPAPAPESTPTSEAAE